MPQVPAGQLRLYALGASSPRPRRQHHQRVTLQSLCHLPDHASVKPEPSRVARVPARPLVGLSTRANLQQVHHAAQLAEVATDGLHSPPGVLDDLVVRTHAERVGTQSAEQDMVGGRRCSCARTGSGWAAPHSPWGLSSDSRRTPGQRRSRSRACPQDAQGPQDPTSWQCGRALVGVTGGGPPPPHIDGHASSMPPSD